MEAVMAGSAPANRHIPRWPASTSRRSARVPVHAGPAGAPVEGRGRVVDPDRVWRGYPDPGAAHRDHDRPVGFPTVMLPYGMVAGIYTRISMDRVGGGLGVERQEQDCRELCARRGWEV